VTARRCKICDAPGTKGEPVQVVDGVAAHKRCRAAVAARPAARGAARLQSDAAPPVRGPGHLRFVADDTGP
jgi:hypothetical protein